MAKRRTSVTPEKIDRWVEEGRGSGVGKEYQPWLRIQSFSSNGIVRRVLGWKTNRMHHLFSKLEQKYFYMLEWSRATDIREQFPLLPQTETISIADQLGIKHPTDVKTKQPIVMTTDFLVTISDGLTKTQYARTLKYAKSLQSQRTMEKFEIERQYWSKRGIDWGIVTEREIPLALVTNIEFLHNYRSLDERLGLSADQLHDIAVSLTARAQQGSSPLRQIAAEGDRALGFKPGTSLTVAYHLIASRRWMVDMYRKISPAKPIRLLAVNDRRLM